MRTTTATARIAAALLLLAVGAIHAATDTSKGMLTLVVQGRAFTPAGPLVGATVTGFGGLGSPTATTNATGDFTVTINFPSAAELGFLVVRGAGAQSHIELKSAPGSYTVMSLAAVDTTLDRTEDPYVDLTPHTTGVYLAMRAIDPLADEAGWHRARRSFVPEDSIQRTYIVGALADGLAPLPAGTTTTLEAASTLPELQQVQDVLFPNGGACGSPQICTLVTQLSGPSSVPVLAAPALDMEYRSYRPFQGQDPSDLAALTLSTGGTGGVVTAQQRTAIVWAPIGDYIRVHRADDGPMASNEFFSSLPCSGGSQVRTVFETVAFRVRQLAAPGGDVLLQVGAEFRTTYPDTPACTATNQANDPVRYLRAVAASAVPVPFADPTGKVLLLPVCETNCADPPQNSVSQLNRAIEPHRFDTGGLGAQLRIGRAFTWTLAGGRLQIAYANGHSANVTQVSDERDDFGTAVTRYIDGTAVHHITWGTVVEKDAAASFGATLEAAAAAYDSKINREYPFGSVQEANRYPFGFVFTPDGTGSRLDGFAGFFRWTLPAPDRIQHDRFPNSGSAVVNQRRFWEVIRVFEDQLLVLESFDQTAPFEATERPTDRLFVYVRNGLASASSAPDAPTPLATPGDAGDSAGTAVASGGDFVVIGAPNAAVGGTDGGAVYVYRKPAPAAPVAGKETRTHWTMKDLTLVATLTAPAPALGDKWGASVTVSDDGSRIAIGAPGAATTGQVAVFAMPGGGWSNGLTPATTLTPPAIAGTTVQNFGASIAMTPGGTLAIGAPGSDVGAMADAGIASIYTPNGGGFNAPQQMVPTSPQPGAAFGSAVAASDSLLAIGAPSLDDASGNRDTGAVYTFRAPTAGAAFNFNSTLQLPGADSIGNKFGAGVAVTGDTLLVGAPFADTSRGHDTGSGYIYEGTAGSLPSSPTTQLVPQGVEGDATGLSVGMIDGFVVLGAPDATRDGFLKSGTAFVFRRPGSTWSDDGLLVSERELGPGQTQANQRFGASIALARDLVVAGSPNRDRGANTDQGEADAFAFDRIFGATFE